jgi:uncharacterized membrane protein
VWLATIAVTAVGGAVIGALVGADIGARGRETGRVPTLSAWVVTWGTACGIVFSYGTGYVVAFARERPPDFDLVSFSAGLAGGAVGWLLGTMIGRTRRHRETSARGELPALIVLVFSAVALGLALVAGIRSASFGPMIDEVGRKDPRLVPVEIAAWAGTVAVAGTFVVLAFRTTSHRTTRTDLDR